MSTAQKSVDALTKQELIQEAAEWISDMNSAYWEATPLGEPPSENRGKALCGALYELAKKLETGEWALARVIHEHPPLTGKVTL